MSPRPVASPDRRPDSYGRSPRAWSPSLQRRRASRRTTRLRAVFSSTIYSSRHGARRVCDAGGDGIRIRRTSPPPSASWLRPSTAASAGGTASGDRRRQSADASATSGQIEASLDAGIHGRIGDCRTARTGERARPSGPSAKVHTRRSLRRADPRNGRVRIGIYCFHRLRLPGRPAHVTTATTPWRSGSN